MADKEDVKKLMSRFESLNKTVQTTGNAVRSRRGYTNDESRNPPQKSTISNLSTSQRAPQPAPAPAPAPSLMQSQKKAAQPPPAPAKNTTPAPATKQTTNNNLMASTKPAQTPANPPNQQPKPTNLMGSQPKQATPAPAQPKPAPAPQPTPQPKQAEPAPKRATFVDDGDDDDDDVQLRKKPLNRPKADPNRKSLAAPLAPLIVNRPPPDDYEMPLSNYNTQTSTAEQKPQIKHTTSSNNLNFEIGDKWKINYDDLEFDQLVSAGSAGEVYLGYYFGTPVAIKKLFSLPPDQKHLVAREFSMMQSLNHPNIVQFLGICDDSSGIYLITEYVENGDLFDLLIFSDKEVSWKNKVKIALQIAYACYYLHSRNIIHRDLKSQNVLIGENFKVKLCDLGLATVLENKKRMTVCGTDEWMAPEIVVSETYDNKVDVFSFGIVLTEMITNQPPKKRGFADKFQFSVDAFRKSIPEGCPDELAQIVIDCTKFEPKDRPPFKEIVPRLKKLVETLDD